MSPVVLRPSAPPNPQKRSAVALSWGQVAAVAVLFLLTVVFVTVYMVRRHAVAPPVVAPLGQAPNAAVSPQPPVAAANQGPRAPQHASPGDDIRQMELAAQARQQSASDRETVARVWLDPSTPESSAAYQEYRTGVLRVIDMLKGSGPLSDQEKDRVIRGALIAAHGDVHDAGFTIGIVMGLASKYPDQARGICLPSSEEEAQGYMDTISKENSDPRAPQVYATYAAVLLSASGP